MIGAGTMGGGIAMNFANAGIPVTVVEVAQEALDRGLGVVRKNYEATAARGRLTRPRTSRSAWASSRAPPTGQAIADADIVIEAVFEEMPIKKEVFAKLDAHRQARRGAGHQHLHARRRRDRLGHQAAGERDRHALLQPRPTSCGCSRTCAARSRPKDVIATAMARGPADRQGAGAGRRLLRLRRQPHAAPARPAGREAASWRARCRSRSTRCSTTSASRWARSP